MNPPEPSPVPINRETLLLVRALHAATTRPIDLKVLDADGVVTALFALASQLEADNPGICMRHGWAKLDDLQGFAAAIAAAAQATAPDGLH